MPPPCATSLVLCPQRSGPDGRPGGRARLPLPTSGSSGDDLDRVEGFDPEAFLARSERLEADGVVATKDQSALLAAVAARRGLPGPDPAAVLALPAQADLARSSSESLRRARRRAAALARRRRCRSAAVLREAGRRPALGGRACASTTSRISRGCLPPTPTRTATKRSPRSPAPSRDTAHGFLAEELLDGQEVTLEGYVHAGRGDDDRRDRLGHVSGHDQLRALRVSELARPRSAGGARRISPRAWCWRTGSTTPSSTSSSSCPEESPPGIVELNARLASQFAPLVLGVNGRSTYDALFALACGDDPGLVYGPPDGVGVSYVIRVFDDALVEDVPRAGGRRRAARASRDCGSPSRA